MLAELRVPFSAEESGYEENMELPLAPRVLARYLALGKARASAARHRDAIVIGADTFAVFRGKLLGKPHTPARARAMLAILSGETHELLTGFAIVDSKTGRSVAKTIVTRVTFRALSPAEISAYVKTGEPLKVAGAYAIQGRGMTLIEKIVGDPNNAAGFPIAALMTELRGFGIAI